MRLHKILSSLYQPYKRFFDDRLLIWLLIKREFATRTAGTVLGSFWILAQPALQIAGLWFFLHIVLKIKTTGAIPFTSYLLVSMTAWNLISEALVRTSSAMADYAPLYQRANFPIDIIPFVPLSVSILLNGTILIVVSGILGGLLAALYALLFSAWLFIILTPAAFLLSTVGLFVRELRQLLPFAVTMLLYLSPILYTPEHLSPEMREWMGLNPIAANVVMLEGLVYGGEIVWRDCRMTILLWIVFMPLGWALFKEAEPHMREAL